MNYVWYAGYGSNLSEQRFLCYIRGGTPFFGRRRNNGCIKDQALPVENKPIIISYPLYFALPNNKKETENWGTGGVAFIRCHEDKTLRTFCRMWKITKEQYEEVKKQEGRSWYCKEIPLGQDNGVPIYTITHDADLNNILCPPDAYIQTIAIGLQETYNLNEEEIANYLLDKDGIRGNLNKEDLLKIIVPPKKS